MLGDTSLKSRIEVLSDCRLQTGGLPGGNAAHQVGGGSNAVVGQLRIQFAKKMEKVEILSRAPMLGNVPVCHVV